MVFGRLLRYLDHGGAKAEEKPPAFCNLKLVLPENTVRKSHPRSCYLCYHDRVRA